METKSIGELIATAADARLDGLDFIGGFSFAELEQGYNGIGPEFLLAAVRDWITKHLEIFEPAALIHDMRFTVSDGTRASFLAANDEFRRNCLKLADHAHPWYSWKRYRARAVAQILFDFVSSDNTGWKAWIEANGKPLSRQGLRPSIQRDERC